MATAMEVNAPATILTKELLPWRRRRDPTDRGGSLCHGSLPCWEDGGRAWMELTPSTSCGSFSPQRSHNTDAIDDVPKFDLLESDDEEWAVADAGRGDSVAPRRSHINTAFGSDEEAKRPKTARTSASGCFSWLFGDLFKSRDNASRAHVWRRCDDKVEYELEQCEHVGMLGCGSFGSVSLVRCRITGQSLALKAISKGLIVRRQLERTLTSEKQAMCRCQSPFVVRLAATFNREQHVYFLLEAVMGGDLHTVYQRRFLFGSERHTCFYMACVVRALEHLHDQWIIYRDLKLENIVLDSRGYGKLCDFGLSAVLRPGHERCAFTVCGTPEYMAPEVFSGATGYTVAADWWSLGVLVYEMMVADTPFVAEDTCCIHKSVDRGIQAMGLPEHCAWAEVVHALCELEPCQRLPMQEGGIAKLQQKEWFCKQCFDWDAHSRQSLEAPYLPSISSPRDLSNFNAGEQRPPPEVPYVDLGTGWDAEFEDAVGPRLSGA